MNTKVEKLQNAERGFLYYWNIGQSVFTTTTAIAKVGYSIFDKLFIENYKE